MKKFFIIFTVIVLDVFLLIGFLVIRDAVSLNSLNKEVSVLNKLDFFKDDFNRKIKSYGSYAVIEKNIKKYLSSCSEDVKNMVKITEDKKLTNILSYENYNKDGPEFNDSLKFLNESKDDYNKIVDNLLYKLDDKYVYDYINEKKLDKYYIDVYRDIMINGQTNKKLKDLNKVVNKSRDDTNVVFNTSIDVLNFLKLYKDDWKLEDGEIRFKTQELYDYYNGLISMINS